MVLVSLLNVAGLESVVSWFVLFSLASLHCAVYVKILISSVGVLPRMNMLDNKRMFCVSMHLIAWIF